MDVIRFRDGNWSGVNPRGESCKMLITSIIQIRRLWVNLEMWRVCSLILEENLIGIFDGDKCKPTTWSGNAYGFEWGPQLQMPWSIPIVDLNRQVWISTVNRIKGHHLWILRRSLVWFFSKWSEVSRVWHSSLFEVSLVWGRSLFEVSRVRGKKSFKVSWVQGSSSFEVS